MSFPLVSLGDFVKIARNGISPEKIQSGTNYVGLENIDGSGNFVDVKGVDAGELASSKFLFTQKQVLFGKLRPYLKKIARPDFDGICSTDILPLLPAKEIDRDYLFHTLRRQSFVDDVSSLSSGANLPRISPTVLSEMQIPLPPLEEQRRIATILDKADALRAQRRAAIAKLDDLLQSVFIEMFGNPVMNPKGWAIGSLGAHGSFKNGLNFGKGESGVTVRYVGVGDFQSRASLDYFGSLGFIELNDLPAEDYFLHDGDLLVVRSNGNRELVGRCMAVYPGMEKVTYSGFCIRYRIADVSLQSTYVAHLFRSVPFRRLIFQGGQGANIQNINQQILSDLPIPIPDEGLQSQFAAIVEKIGAQKQIMQRAAEKSDAFFTSLQHLAFSGKL